MRYTTMNMTTQASNYGVFETNPLPQGHHDNYSSENRVVQWTEKGLYINRLRLLGDFHCPQWDVSYCHGTVTHKDGSIEHVRVELPFGSISRKKLKAEILRYAKQDGVYAKGLGILDNISTMI